jgi:hypothetical protein
MIYPQKLEAVKNITKVELPIKEIPFWGFLLLFNVETLQAFGALFQIPHYYRYYVLHLENKIHVNVKIDNRQGIVTPHVFKFFFNSFYRIRQNFFLQSYAKRDFTYLKQAAKSNFAAVAFNDGS